jgi:hypothetical protein
MCLLWGMNCGFTRISHKMTFFIVTAVETWNLTWKPSIGILLGSTTQLQSIPSPGASQNTDCSSTGGLCGRRRECVIQQSGPSQFYCRPPAPNTETGTARDLNMGNMTGRRTSPLRVHLTHRTWKRGHTKKIRKSGNIVLRGYGKDSVNLFVCLWNIGRKARGKETTRKTKT